MEKQKPLSVAIRETRNAIVETLNNSGLTYDVASFLLREILLVVNEQSERAYEEELAKWNDKKGDD